MESGTPPPAGAERSYEDFLRLYSRDQTRLAAYVFSLLPHAADAEDVFQRVSLLLWQKFREYDSDRDFLTWACGVAFYEVKNFLRLSRHRRLQFDSELMSRLADRRMQSLEQGEERLVALRGCLENLRGADRNLLQIAYDSNQTLKDFATGTGQALQTLYNRLARVRRTLLDCVQKKLAMES